MKHTEKHRETQRNTETLPREIHKMDKKSVQLALLPVKDFMIEMGKVTEFKDENQFASLLERLMECDRLLKKTSSAEIKDAEVRKGVKSMENLVENERWFFAHYWVTHLDSVANV